MPTRNKPGQGRKPSDASGSGIRITLRLAPVLLEWVDKQGPNRTEAVRSILAQRMVDDLFAHPAPPAGSGD